MHNPCEKLFFKVLNGAADLVVFLNELADLVAGVHDGRVVAPAEEVADARGRKLGLLPNEIHGDLPGLRDFAVAPLGEQVRLADAEIPRDGLDDGFGRRGARFCRGHDPVERFLGDIQRDLAAVQLGHGVDASERALELADIGFDLFCDVVKHAVGYVDVLQLGLFVKDRDARFIVRLLDIRDQSPFEAGAKAFLQRWNFLRRPVGGYDDLLAVSVQLVEGMEEFLLRRGLSRDELYVVDHEHIDGAQPVAQLLAGALGDGVDQLICEVFGGDVEQLRVRIVPVNMVADGVHQVRLAQSRAAVEKERIVGVGRELGHGEGRRMGKAVRSAHDEGIESVFRIKHRRGQNIALCRILRHIGFGRGGKNGIFALGNEINLEILAIADHNGVFEHKIIALAHD